MSLARAVATRLSRSARVPSSGLTAVCPPSAAPIAQGLPGSPGAAVGELLRPLRWVTPIGWIGGRYTTSKPSSARAGSCSSTPFKPAEGAGKELVPGAHARPLAVDVHLQQRGAQPLGPARRPLQGDRDLRGQARRGALGAAAVGAQGLGGGQAVRRSAPRSPAAAVSSRIPAPSASSLARSCWPAPSLRSTSPRHEPNVSTHASTWNWWRPRSLVAKEPRHSSGDTWTIGSSRKRGDPGGRWRTTARSCSWPSRTIVGLDHHAVPGGPLDGPATAIDGRADVVDLDARRGSAWHGDGHRRH